LYANDHKDKLTYWDGTIAAQKLSPWRTYKTLIMEPKYTPDRHILFANSNQSHLKLKSCIRYAKTSNAWQGWWAGHWLFLRNKIWTKITRFVSLEPKIDSQGKARWRKHLPEVIKQFIPQLPKPSLCRRVLAPKSSYASVAELVLSINRTGY
jgi:hypothetical protein